MLRIALLFYTLFLSLSTTVVFSADSTIALLDESWKPDHTARALSKRGEPFTSLSSTSLKDTLYPLAQHPILVVSEWWTENTGKVLNASRDRIREYVRHGGVMVVFYSQHIPCDTKYWTSSWSPEPVYVRLNNASDDCQKNIPVFQDVIDNTDHPLFAGIHNLYLDVAAKKSFSSSDPYWYVLAKNREQGLPTIMERRHEKGTYLLVGPALAYHYGARRAATLLFDNIITYALSVADQVSIERISQKKQQKADSLAVAAEQHARSVAESLAVVAASEMEPDVIDQPSSVDDISIDEEFVAEDTLMPTEIENLVPDEDVPDEDYSDVIEEEQDAFTSIPEAPIGVLLPLAEGNSWTFSNDQTWSITGTKNILKQTVSILNFSAGMGAYFISWEQGGVVLYGSSEGGVDNVHSSPQVIFKYPATEGETYHSDIAIGGIDALITVGGTDTQIETDMGVFSCYEYVVEFGNSVQYWYLCPEIGFVRYMIDDENMVLVDYTVQ